MYLIKLLIYLNIINLGGLAIGVPGELKGYSAIYELYGGGVSWESLFKPTSYVKKEYRSVNV